MIHLCMCSAYELDDFLTVGFPFIKFCTLIKCAWNIIIIINIKLSSTSFIITTTAVFVVAVVGRIAAL